MNRSIQIAIIIAIIPILWMFTGIFRSSKTEETSIKTEEKLARVRYRTSIAQDRYREKLLRGQTKANRTVELRAKIAGSIQELLVEKGSRVAENQPLLKISLEDRAQRLGEAKANFKKQEADYKAYQTLNAKKFASDTELATKKAELELSRANLQRAELELDYTVVKAPFKGVFDSRFVEVGDLVSVGQPLGKVIEIDPLKVEVPVAEDLIGNLKLNQLATVKVYGKSHEGKITFIGSDSEAATRMFPIEVTLPNPNHEVVSGVTAEVQLTFEKVLAHFITPALLALKEDGEMGVKFINEENTTVFYPVEIISQTDKGMWVKGLPPQGRLMTVGQDYVTVGQKVDPLEDTEKLDSAEVAS